MWKDGVVAIFTLLQFHLIIIVRPRWCQVPNYGISLRDCSSDHRPAGDLDKKFVKRLMPNPIGGLKVPPAHWSKILVGRGPTCMNPALMAPSAYLSSSRVAFTLYYSKWVSRLISKQGRPGRSRDRQPREVMQEQITVKRCHEEGVLMCAEEESLHIIKRHQYCERKAWKA